MSTPTDDQPIKKAMFDLGMVRTAFNAEQIEQMVDWPEMVSPITDRMQKHVLHLREVGVQRALVALGWVPPGGTEDVAVALVAENRMLRDALTRIANHAADVTGASSMQKIASEALDNAEK